MADSNFYDLIIDEAEELAILSLLPDHATQEQITKAVGEAVNERIAINSTASRLAEAAYRRKLWLLVNQHQTAA